MYLCQLYGFVERAAADWCQRWSIGRSDQEGWLLGVNHYEEHVASPVIAWGTLLLHSNLFVLFFQGPLRLKRTGSSAFLRRLVNMTHCPVEQKKGSSPCPVLLTRRSHCPDAGAEAGVKFVKARNIFLCNMKPYFRASAAAANIQSSIQDFKVMIIFRASKFLLHVWYKWQNT